MAILSRQEFLEVPANKLFVVNITSLGEFQLDLCKKWLSQNCSGDTYITINRDETKFVFFDEDDRAMFLIWSSDGNFGEDSEGTIHVS